MAQARSMFGGGQDDDDIVAFTLKLTLPPKEGDNALAVAKAYYAKFGLTDEKIIRQFTFFANQYSSESDNSPGFFIGKRLFGGPKGRLYCSEAVVTWYNNAGIPITYMSPDHVPPKLIAEDYFKGTLLEVGYLRYMP